MHNENLVIGAGLAGLSLALKIAEFDKVTILCKGELVDCNSYYAQGGIATVLDESDSFEQHVQDTMVAGAGLCHEDIVRIVVESGPQAINDLISQGVEFTKTNEEGKLHLTKEGGHSERRVIHSKDTTGVALMSALIAKASKNPNITIYTNQVVVDLVTSDKVAPDFHGNRCLGAYVLDVKTGQIKLFKSARTYLATGGYGRLYLYTSNPENATGDGLAVARRAGCKVANLEFMQFHPTCLFHPDAKTFLLSEALRGEGGVLKNKSGEEFMKQYHHMGSLAPRDIVARAIDTELKKSGETNVYLDVRSMGIDKIKGHFPNIYETCLGFDIDISKDLIPVVPAAHYACGGLVVDEFGSTNVANLFALGEVSCTGLHGANRLASNSLLEAVVFSRRVADYVKSHPVTSNNIDLPEWNSGTAIPPDEQVVLSHNWDEIRRLMWHYVGIVRTNNRLKRALSRVNAIREELNTYYWEYHVTENFLEVRNLADVAWMTIKCAMKRKESRGIHYNQDYPQTNSLVKDTVI